MNTFLAYSQKLMYVSPEQRLNLKADTTELIADTTERDIEFYEEKNIENVRET